MVTRSADEKKGQGSSPGVAKGSSFIPYLLSSIKLFGKKLYKLKFALIVLDETRRANVLFLRGEDIVMALSETHLPSLIPPSEGN